MRKNEWLPSKIDGGVTKKLVLLLAFFALYFIKGRLLPVIFFFVRKVIIKPLRGSVIKLITIFVLVTFTMVSVMPHALQALVVTPVPGPESLTTIVSTADCQLGSLPGQSGVSCTGAGTYTIPIEVPPGTAHMSPELSLNYNSQSGDGILGMGFSINGLSAISRCAANVALDSQIAPALDGFKGGINYDGNDRFCLDGQRLIPKAPFGGAIQEYRTEPDTFARIKSYGTTSTGGADYFTVEAKSGLITEYGNTINSKIEAISLTPMSHVRVWAANKLSDQLGNYLDYTYEEKNITNATTKATGEYHITEISYTGNDHTIPATAPYNFVKFEYEKPANSAPFYQGGSVVQITELLSKIKTCTSNGCTGTDLVNEYNLSYDAGTPTARMHLKTVQLCDGPATSSSTKCFPKTELTWSDDDQTSLNDLVGTNSSGSIDGSSLWAQNFASGSGKSFMKARHPLYADAFFPAINAVANAPDNKSLAINSVGLVLSGISLVASPIGSIISWAVNAIITLVTWWDQDFMIMKTKLGDVNGDGKTDVIGFEEKKSNQPTEYVWLTDKTSAGYAFNQQPNWQTKPLSQDSNDVSEPDEVKMADINGDGISDVLTYEDYTGSSGTPDGVVYLSKPENSPPEFKYEGMVAYDIGTISEGLLGDFNGDGKTDVANFGANGHVYLNTGTYIERHDDWTTKGAAPEDVLLGDVNGDGKTDMVHFVVYNSQMYARVYLTNKDSTNWTGDPSFNIILGTDIDLHSDPPDVIQPGDFNGDGKMDLAVFKAYDDSQHYDGNGNGVEDPDDPEVYAAQFMVYLSTGKSFKRTDSFTRDMLGRQAPLVRNYPNYSALSKVELSFVTRLADFNGDGKTDVATFDPTEVTYSPFSAHTAHVYLSTGTQLMVNFAWGSGFGDIDEDAIGDFDGDGRADVLQVVGGPDEGELRVTLNNGYPFPDLLTKVTDGFKEQTKFEYQPITNNDIYQKDNLSLNDFDSETYNIRGPLYVVSKHSISNGIGGFYDNDYKYFGARSHRSYGFLGFSKIEMLDPQTTTTDTTEYVQEYDKRVPLVCHPKSHTVNKLRATGNKPVVEQGYTWSVSPGGPPHLIQLDQMTVLERELDGSPSLPGSTIRDDVINYTYDNFGNIVESLTEWAGTGLVTEQISREYTNIQNATKWILGLSKKTTLERSEPLASDPRVTERQFDPANGLLMKTTSHLDGNKTLITDYGHDTFGNVNLETTSGTDIVTRQTATQFTADGRFPIGVDNQLGQHTILAYESEFGNLQSSTDPNNLTTSWQYDGFGRQTLETRPDNTTMQTSYCAKTGTFSSPAQSVHWILQKTSGLPDQSVFYDTLGREVRASTIGFNGVKIYTDSVYNANLLLGRRSLPYYAQIGSSSSVAPLNSYPESLGPTIYWTYYAYDNNGRVKKITPPQGPAAETIYSYSGNASLEPYPSSLSSLSGPFLWRKVTQENGLGQKTDQLINRLGQVNQVNSRDAADALLSKVTYEYDGFDNIVKVADTNGNVTQRESHDDLMTLLNDPDLGTWHYNYDVLGQLKTATDPSFQTTTYDYDLLGRPVSRTESEGISTWEYSTTAPSIGRLTKVDGMDVNGYSQSYEYDALSRPKKITTTLPGSITPYTTEVSYDAYGRINTLKYPGSPDFTVQYLYNTYGYLNQVQRITPTPTKMLWGADSLNALNQLTGQRQGNNLISKFTYDPRQNTLTGINISTKKSLAYTYDSLGNVTKRNDYTLLPNQEAVETFEYDSLNRMTHTTDFIQDHFNQVGILLDGWGLDYNAIGNMTYNTDIGSLNGTPNPNYTYYTGGTLPHAVKKVCDDNTCYPDILYDAAGNMTSGIDLQNGTTRTIDWYSFNKPQKIEEVSQSKSLTFDYNPYRDKVKQVSVIGADTTTTEYIGSLYEKVTNITTGLVEQKHYIYGMSSLPIGVYTTRSDGTSDTRYFHYDNLGSPVVITDEAGTIVEKLSFDPHGVRRNPDWSPATGPITSLTSIGFTGQEQLDAFGIVDMKGRIYDPKLGRFLSADPYVPDPFSSESLNRYSYVNNNPATLVDPSGFQSIGGTGSIMLSEVVIKSTRVITVSQAVRVFGSAAAQTLFTQAIAWHVNLAPVEIVAKAIPPTQTTQIDNTSTGSRVKPATAPKIITERDFEMYMADYWWTKMHGELDLTGNTAVLNAAKPDISTLEERKAARYMEELQDSYRKNPNLATQYLIERETRPFWERILNPSSATNQVIMKFLNPAGKGAEAYQQVGPLPAPAPSILQ